MVNLGRLALVLYTGLVFAACHPAPKKSSNNISILIGMKSGPLTLLSLDGETFELKARKTLGIENVNYLRNTGGGPVFGLTPDKILVLDRQSLNSGGIDELAGADTQRDPTAIEVSPDARLIYTAHWSDNILSVRHLDDSSFRQPQDFDCDWAHQFRPHPNGKWAYAACMKNTVMQFDVDIENEKVSPMSKSALSVNGGPRHIEFHPDGEVLYVLLQISSEVAVFDIDPESGKLSAEPSQIVKTTLDGSKDKSSDIHITPDGRWLYAFNRGRQDMAVFKVLEDHTLKLAHIIPMSFGEVRDWAMSNDGTYLVTASDKGHVGVWQIDSDTGVLTLAVEQTDLGNAVSVAILN